MDRGESHPTFLRSSCFLDPPLLPELKGVRPPSKPPLTLDDAAAPPLVRSSNLLAAGVRISNLLGVDAVNFVRSSFGVARGVELLPLSSPARLEIALPASEPSRRPRLSRAPGALMTKGDRVESSPPEMMRGVARRVPSVMSSFMPCGPSCEGEGDGTASTNPKPRIFGESERETSVDSQASMLCPSYEGTVYLQGVPDIAAAMRLRVGLGGSLEDPSTPSFCSGNLVLA